MKIFYISVMAHYNYKDTLEFYFDSEDKAIKYIENKIKEIKKIFNNVTANQFQHEKTYHIYNSNEINHVYKIHELKKYGV